MSTAQRQPDWWSWRRVLEEIPMLGIPHFQRGQVWDQGNRVALLESMWDASPCGSFVLWQPEGEYSWERIGISLADKRPVGPQTKWLVDGQQRSRTLLGVYRDMLMAENDPASPRMLGEDVVTELRRWLPGNDQAEDPEEVAESNDDPVPGKPTWYAVLPALESLQPIFGSWAESRQVLRGSLFRKHHPAGQKAKRVPLPRGLVPLAVLLAKESGPFAVPSTRDEVLRALEAERRDCQTLDRLVPWGPQFLTGFTFKKAGKKWQQIRWDSVPQNDVAKFAALLSANIEDLAKFPAMLDGPRFAVGSLPRTELGAAITAYVRINRAGVRVQPEEQALALLTRWDESLLDHLGEFCKERDGAKEAADDQRALLSHETGKQMGFPLWMATVTRYTALISLAKTAHHWLGVSAMDKQTFVDELERWPKRKRTYQDQKELICTAAQQASGALLLIDDILANELWLDHRMARRDANTLQPMLELLSHASAGDLAVMKENGQLRSALARLLHLTMLHPHLDDGEKQDLCDAIHEPSTSSTDGTRTIWRVAAGDGRPNPAGDFGMALRRYVESLHKLWMHERERGQEKPARSAGTASEGRRLDELQAWGLEQFSRDVDAATSLQSSAVGWLYALERRNGARELNWQVQIEAHRKDKSAGIGHQEAPTFAEQELATHRGQADLYPERQHLVPFSLAKKIAGKGGTRTTASIANAIGNLTWLSARQNGFKHGLSDRWAVFDEAVEADNLRARGMLFASSSKGEKEDRRALDLYREIQARARAARSLKRDDWPKAFDTTYNDFLMVRTAWMKQEMKSWLCESLSSEALHWLVNLDTPHHE